MRPKKLSLFLATLLIVISLCGGLFAQKFHTIKILNKSKDGVTVRAEVALTPEEQAKGLMFRKKLPKNFGMWFIFSADTDHAFWMKNTYIPLDLIFVDSNLDIVSIYRDAKPLSETPINSSKTYRYVLEVNAGFADKNNLKTKQKVRMLTN